MGRQHLRVFVATGTTSFPRLTEFFLQKPIPEGMTFFFQHAQDEISSQLNGASRLVRAEFQERLAWADKVIIHAGAGTIYDAIAAGHQPLLVPRLLCHREVVNDHQLELAHALENMGSAVLCEELDNLFEKLHEADKRKERQVAASQGLVTAVREALLSEHASAMHLDTVLPMGRQVYSRVVKRIFG